MAVCLAESFSGFLSHSQRLWMRYSRCYLDRPKSYCPTTAVSSRHAWLKALSDIQRWDINPKTLRMNGPHRALGPHPPGVLRGDHETPLFTDLALFNQKRADGRVFYDTRRPHPRLGQKTPLSFLLRHQPESQRW